MQNLNTVRYLDRLRAIQLLSEASNSPRLREIAKRVLEGCHWVADEMVTAASNLSRGAHLTAGDDRDDILASLNLAFYSVSDLAAAAPSHILRCAARQLLQMIYADTCIPFKLTPRKDPIQLLSSSSASCDAKTEQSLSATDANPSLSPTLDNSAGVFKITTPCIHPKKSSLSHSTSSSSSAFKSDNEIASQVLSYNSRNPQGIPICDHGGAVPVDDPGVGVPLDEPSLISTGNDLDNSLDTSIGSRQQRQAVLTMPRKRSRTVWVDTDADLAKSPHADDGEKPPPTNRRKMNHRNVSWATHNQCLKFGPGEPLNAINVPWSGMPGMVSSKNMPKIASDLTSEVILT